MMNEFAEGQGHISDSGMCVEITACRVGREVEKGEAGVADYGAWLSGGESESLGSRLRRRSKSDVYIVTIFN